MDIHNIGNIHLYLGDALDCYSEWKSPTIIMSDGAFGISGFKGDLHSSDGLAEWYEPHIKSWSELSTPQTTLWFWNTELGWATVHPIIQKYGWEFKSCNFWNKGLSHVAGNTNTKTLSHLPIVSEVCVQYVKKASFNIKDSNLSMQEWLRHEWARTGLPFSKTNEACGVVDAATRKYFTKCHLWYMPPSEAFEKIVTYANTYGKPEGRPYFSIDGKKPLTAKDWDRQRAKFYCPFGSTNVWEMPQLRNKERLKNGNKAVHLNQKPIAIIRRIIEMTSDKGDVIWEPFGGLFTAAIASIQLERECYSSEIDTNVFNIGKNRVQTELDNELSKLPF